MGRYDTAIKRAGLKRRAALVMVVASALLASGHAAGAVWFGLHDKAAAVALNTFASTLWLAAVWLWRSLHRSWADNEHGLRVCDHLEHGEARRG